MTTEEESFFLIVKGKNSELQIFYVHMTFTWKIFNEVIDFVKNVKGMRQDGQAKTWAIKAKSICNFQGSYSRGSGRTTLATRLIKCAMMIVNRSCQLIFISTEKI